MEFSILFKNLSTLTVVKYTQQKTYHVNHFEVCSSVGLLLLLSRFSHVRLCDPMDCSPPGFSVAGILQVRYSYVVRPLLSSISRTFFLSCRTETLYLLINFCIPPSTSAPGSRILLSVSMNLTALNTSYSVCPFVTGFFGLS